MALSRKRRLQLLLESAVLIVAVNVGLRFASFRTVRRGLRQLPDSKTELETEPWRLLQQINRVTRLLPGENACLVKALCGQTVLRRYGYAVTLRIGVLSVPNTRAIRAHAWLEDEDGTAIAESRDLSRYETLPPLE